MKLVHAPLPFALAAALIGCTPAANDAAQNARTAPPAAETASAAASAASPAPVSATPIAEAPGTKATSTAVATACDQTITFAAGNNAATASGKVAGHAGCSFRMQGQAGQRIEGVLIGSPYLIALLFAPSAKDTAIAGPLDKLDAMLPETGEYEIRVAQVRAEARRNAAPKTFELKVSLR